MKYNVIHIEHSKDFWLTVALGVCAILFLSFYGVLSFNNRLVSDDLLLYNDFIAKGWWRASTEFEFGRRATSHALFHSLFIFNKEFVSSNVQLFLLHLLVLIGFLTGIYRVLTQILFRNFLGSIRKLETVLLSSIVLCAFFFGTMQLNEVWFWAISLTIHLVPIIALFHCLASIFNGKQSIAHLMLVFLCGIYIGGSSEVAAVLILLLFSSIFIFHVTEIRPVGRIFLGKVILASAGVLITLLWNLMGKGSSARIEILTQDGNSSFLPKGVNLLDALLEPRNLVFLGFILFFIFLGSYFGGRKLEFSLKPKLVLFALGFLGLSFLVTYLPLNNLFGGTGPLRAWAPFGFVLMSVMIVGAFYLGNRLLILKQHIRFGIISSLLICSSMIGFYFIRQVPIVTKYSREHDDRLNQLIELQSDGRTELIELEPLSDSGMLPSCEIESDADAWINQLYKSVLHLDYDISKRKD